MSRQSQHVRVGQTVMRNGVRRHFFVAVCPFSAGVMSKVRGLFVKSSFGTGFRAGHRLQGPRFEA